MVQSQRVGVLQSSRLHRHVSKVLGSMGVAHVNEESISGLWVDIAVPDRRIVVEVNGPSHYCRDSRRVLGNTLFKERLLGQLGWHVLVVPYYEWAELHSDQDRRAYLTEKLESAPD